MKELTGWAGKHSKGHYHYRTDLALDGVQYGILSGRFAEYR